MQLEEPGTIRDLVLYRIETAESDLRQAHILFDANEYGGSNNRAYYSIFHSILAVHAMDGRSFKRHKDAIANFNRDYVKTEIFPRELGRRISQAEIVRHHSDYDPFYLASKSETEKQIQTATDLLALVKKILSVTGIRGGKEKRLFPVSKTLWTEDRYSAFLMPFHVNSLGKFEVRG